MLGITHGSSSRGKLGCYSVKKAMESKVGTEGGFADGMSDWNSFGKLKDLE